MDRFLSAPGKLFLSGEYAVLWGGAARLAAIGPRTQAYVRRRDDREVHLVVEEGRLRGTSTPLGVAWEREVPPELRFVARAVDDVLRARGREGLGFGIAFAPSPRSKEGHKLGMGSSARATVLATEAARFILEERTDPLKLALFSHAQSQDGRGSGGDVAASYAGGLLRYRRFDPSPIASLERPLATLLRESPAVDLSRLNPAPLFMLYAFSGESASTPALIRKAESKLDDSARADFVHNSDVLGHQLEEALVRGKFGALEDAVRELSALLRTLGSVETPAIERLIAMAHSYGCAAKLSGAGGGDGCVIFCPDGATRSALEEGYAARGVFTLPLSLEPGLRGEADGPGTLRNWLE